MDNNYSATSIRELMDMADFLYKRGIMYKIGYTDDWHDKKTYYSIEFSTDDDELYSEFDRRFGTWRI